jgi:hypothetical protein
MRLARGNGNGMRHRLLNLATALSLLACAALAALWVRSYLPAEFYAFSRRGRMIVAFTESYRAKMLTTHDDVPPDVLSQWADARAHARMHWEGPGIEFITGPTPPPPGPRFRPYTPGEYIMLSVSHAYLGIAAAAAAAALVYAARRRSVLARRGHCPSCGYDLRATPGRCPECGITAPAPLTRSPTQG